LIARGAVHHFPDPDASLREAARVLKRGSTALFIDPREFAWLEPVKHAIRRSDTSFTDDHHAYRPSEYRDLIGRYFEVEETRTFHPFGILVAVGLDLLPLPSWIPKRILAEELYRLDRTLDRTALSQAGHLVAVRARRI
jgi:SAM-dependent methyltransferase